MTAQENQYGFASRRIDSVERVTLTAVTTTEGSGTVGDYVHRVTRYYDDAGVFVAVSPHLEALFEAFGVQT